MKYIFQIILILLALPISAQEITLDSIISAYGERNRHIEEQWPMNHEANHDKEIQILDELSDALTKISSDDLDENESINKDILELIIRERLYHLRFQSHTFPLNAEGGFLAGVIYATRGVRIESDKALEIYLDGLQKLPKYFDQRMKQMRLGQSQGKSSPKLVVQNCIDLLDQFLDTPVGKTFFDVSDEKIYREKISEVIIKDIRPAYIAFRNYLKNEYLPKAPAAIGISEIKDGKAYYEERVRFYTTYDISPKEVFETGLAEVKRIRAEMEAIIAELGFEGSRSAIL